MGKFGGGAGGEDDQSGGVRECAGACRGAFAGDERGIRAEPRFLDSFAASGKDPRVSPPPPPSELHTSSEMMASVTSREFLPHGGEERDGPGDHWVTIDGNHVLLHEPQGKENQQTPQGLVGQIPAEVRTEMARAIHDSNTPTADDKKGGFHEEFGVAGLDASGKWVVSRDKSGPYANPDVADHVSPSGKPVDPNIAYSIVDPRVFFHVHPDGKTEKHKWNQPPSDIDKKAAIPGHINIVFSARENRVYFYDRSGIIGKPMKLKDFLRP